MIPNERRYLLAYRGISGWYVDHSLCARKDLVLLQRDIRSSHYKINVSDLNKMFTGTQLSVVSTYWCQNQNLDPWLFDIIDNFCLGEIVKQGYLKAILICQNREVLGLFPERQERGMLALRMSNCLRKKTHLYLFRLSRKQELEVMGDHMDLIFAWQRLIQGGLVTPCASCQICKIAGCACAGNVGDVFPVALD